MKSAKTLTIAIIAIIAISLALSLFGCAVNPVPTVTESPPPSPSETISATPSPQPSADATAFSGAVIDYVTKQYIGKEVDVLVFRLRGETVLETFDFGTGIWRNYYSRIDSLAVYNNDGSLLQEFKWLDTQLPLGFYGGIYGLSFDDYNFDGYTDIRLHSYEGGSMRNEPSYFWLWDAESGQFVKNEKLEDLSNFAFINFIDIDTIYAFSRISGYSHYTEYYKYENGEYREYANVYDRIENGKRIITAEELIDGEWVTTEESFDTDFFGEPIE
ncbi:MAG: hypothetical protein LBN02_02640 [Oscillospiraceae bacterium]|jgi:hypothetical protein|nr:hypothetical protein [Oscillospiraceae bacterium]